MEPTTHLDQVSVLGTGAIGTAVVSALLAAGRPVVVWNRTPSGADPAVAAGARLATTAAEAIEASPLTLVCLTDQAAAVSVLRDLPASADRSDPRRTVVLLTTGTPEEALAVHELLGERGLDHLDAGVQTAPADVGTPQALFVVSGEPTVYQAHRSALELLGRVEWVGADPAAAAVWDLALFGLWYDAQLGLLRALELTAGAGIDPHAFAEAAATQLGHVVSAVGDTVDEAADGTYPAGPASLAEHLRLLRQLLVSRRTARLGSGGLAEVTHLVEELVDAGAGGDGLTALLAGARLSAG